MKLSKFCAAAAAVVFSLGVAQASLPPVHTWHHVTASNGSWGSELVITSANENAYFTDSSGSPRGKRYDFTVQDQQPFKFGFGFQWGTDFNVSYTLTLIKKSPNQSFGSPAFVSPTCQFNASAKGPANPDIRVESYNGAHCDWKTVPGQGEDFFVS